MSTRLAFLNNREHVTEQIKIAGPRTFYVAHNGNALAEIFLRIKGQDLLVRTERPVRRLLRRSLQYGLDLRSSAFALLEISLNDTDCDQAEPAYWGNS